MNTQTAGSPGHITPIKLNLKRDEMLSITWSTGQVSVYPIAYLRSMCPCAACRIVRAEKANKKVLLNILPGNYAQPLSAVKAELVGNYALKIDWSDDHTSGIYSYEYLLEIRPDK